MKTKHPQKHTQQLNIPLWMLDDNKLSTNIQKSKKTNFLIKTIKELSSIMQNEILSEKFVKTNGYLQIINPAIKLLTILVFILFSSLTKSIITLISLGFIALTLAKLSALNLKDYFKRIWLIIPLWVFIFSIPASTSLFSKGAPLFYIYKSLKIAGIPLPNELYISITGLIMILKMSLRIGISVSFTYLLIMTTRWSSITQAFSVFRVPQLIITIFNMTYRYIFILSKTAAEMMEARILRTVGSTGQKSGRNFMSRSMSFLFIKSNFLSDEVYSAMRCRGFCGGAVSLYKFKIGKADLLWIVNNLLILIVLFLGELIT